MIYGLMALMTPSYAMFLGGLFVATMAFKMVSSAIFGVINTLAQKRAVSGKMNSLISIGSALPSLIPASAVVCSARLWEARAPRQQPVSCLAVRARR